jgi:hypothetical protein
VNNLTPSNLARALAARRQRQEYTCEVCGGAFVAWKRERQAPRTCSGRCRVALSRREKRAREDRPEPL